MTYPKNNNFVKINYYKEDKKTIYKPRKKMFLKEICDVIKKNLDKEQEHKLNYI